MKRFSPLSHLHHRCYALLICCFALSGLAQGQSYVPSLPNFPHTTAWLLMDAESGTVLEESNGFMRTEPASITKLALTYILAASMSQGKIRETDIVKVSQNARNAVGSRMFLEVGDRVSVHDLMQGVAVHSGNDATIALAEHIAGSEEQSVILMNELTKALGMNTSHFTNVTGLPDPDHYSSAYDLAILARRLIRDYPEVYKIYSQKTFTYNNITQKNRNTLLWQDPSVDGVKTGHTDVAGYCLVASARRNDLRLITVVLGAKNDADRFTATQALLNHGYSLYEQKRIYSKGDVLLEVPLTGGDRTTLPLVAPETIRVLYPKKQYTNIEANVQVMYPLSAPVKKGDSIGKLVLRLEDKVLGEYSLQAGVDVVESNLPRRLINQILGWFR